MRDPFAFLAVGQADGAERPVKRDARDHQGSGGCVDRKHVVRVRLVSAEDSGDNLRLVAETLGERRAQRPVGEAAGEDCILGRAAFTTEERTGDLASGVCTLFDVDREREEVHAIADGLRCVRSGQYLCCANRCHDGTHRLGGKSARFKGECLVGP